MLESKIKIR